jgi:hypothetical protein
MNANIIVFWFSSLYILRFFISCISWISWIWWSFNTFKMNLYDLRITFLFLCVNLLNYIFKQQNSDFEEIIWKVKKINKDDSWISAKASNSSTWDISFIWFKMIVNICWKSVMSVDFFHFFYFFSFLFFFLFFSFFSFLSFLCLKFNVFDLLSFPSLFKWNFAFIRFITILKYHINSSKTID